MVTGNGAKALRVAILVVAVVVSRIWWCSTPVTHARRSPPERRALGDP